MSSTHIATIRRAAAAMAAHAALLATPALAQSEHVVGTYGHFESATYHCDAPDGVASYALMTCNGGGAVGKLMARVDADNTLHALAEVTSTPFWGNNMWRATAEAFFSDRIEFVGDAPTEIRLDVRLHGNVRGPRGTEGSVLGYRGGIEPVWGVGLRNTDGWGVVSGTFIVPVVNNVAVFGLKLLTNAQIIPYDMDDPCGAIDCGHAIADFSNTASIERIVGLDANGDEITGGLVARTDSHVAYNLQGGSILATPEPASLALLGAGAAPLAWLVGRRRRAALARR